MSAAGTMRTAGQQAAFEARLRPPAEAVSAAAGGWQHQAACAPANRPDWAAAALWFPAVRSRGPNAGGEYAAARLVCEGCPVQAECRKLGDALGCSGEPAVGYWASTPSERRRGAPGGEPEPADGFAVVRLTLF